MTKIIGTLFLVKDKSKGTFEVRYERFNGSVAGMIETFVGLQEQYEFYEIRDITEGTLSIDMTAPTVQAAVTSPQSTIEPAPAQTSPQKELKPVEAPSESKEVYPNLRYFIRCRDYRDRFLNLNSELCYELIPGIRTVFASRDAATLALNQYIRDQPVRGYWRREEFEIIGDNI